LPSSAPDFVLTRAFAVALVAVTSIGPLAMQLFVPALPAVASGFEVSTATANLAISLSFFTVGVSTLVYGPLSDRYGRRPVLFAGLALFVIGTLVCLAAPSIEVLLLGRVLQAAGSASGLVIARAVVRDVYGPERAASVMAYLMMAMVVAPMLAVIAGGFLIEFGGWRLIFVLALAAGVLVAGLAWRSLPETNRQRHEGMSVAAMAGNYGTLLRSPVFVAYTVHASASAASFFAFTAAAPFLMVDTLARPVSEFGLYFAFVTLVFMGANFAAGRFSQRLGVRRMVLIGGALTLIASLSGAAWIAIGGLSPQSLFGMAAAFSIGAGISMPNAQAGAINVAPRLAGTAAGATAFLSMTIGAVVAQTVGQFADGTAGPLVWAIVLSAFVALAAAFVPFALDPASHAGPARQPEPGE
jgi:DHA1 family bicyclomycin/chloramphenicol resistance-like MFS transporter